MATPENESAWVAGTERLTVRQLERLVAGRKPGDDPTDAKDPLLTTRRVAFELEAEAYAEWSEAREAVRRMIGPGALDKEVFRAMCEIALGRRDEAKPGYQVSLTVCTRCDRTWRQSGSEAIEVPASVGERAACDAEVVGFTCVDEGARAMSGMHDDDQLTSLCTQYQDAIHDGRLAVEGKPSTGLRFVDARGEIYGSRPTWAT